MNAVKRQKIEQHIHMNKAQRNLGLFDAVPLAIEHIIFSSLCVDDLSNLAMTSRSFQKKVHLYRGEGNHDCYIYREERLPTRISFEAPQNEFSVIPVYQQRPFRFLVRSKRYVLHVEMSLNNLVWDETAYDGIRELDEGDNSSTIVQFKVMRLVVYKNKSVGWQVIFQRHLSWIVPRYEGYPALCNFRRGCFCPYCTGFHLTGFTDEHWSERDGDPEFEKADDSPVFLLSPVSQTYLKESVAAIILCSKRISSFSNPLHYYHCSGDIASNALLSDSMIELFSPRYFDPAEVTHATEFDDCDESEDHFQQEIQYREPDSEIDDSGWWLLLHDCDEFKPFERWWREVEVSSPLCPHVVRFLDEDESDSCEWCECGDCCECCGCCEPCVCDMSDDDDLYN
jgi:hypothetical protein